MSASDPVVKQRMNVWPVIAIALLLAGLGAGYYVGRPATTPTAAPGPVDGLERPTTIPRVDGWYRGMAVQYLDYGPQPNVAAPILVFFRASAPGTMVAGQQNIIDTIPGQPGYSDFWRVHKVLAPADYVANSIRSFEQAMASGYPIEATDILVNCPVVNPGTTIAGGGTGLTSGWYRGREVFYFDHGANSPGEGWVVVDAPIYVFFTAGGAPVAGQKNVIHVKPGDAGYSDLWRVMKVTVGVGYVADSLRDAEAIAMAQEAGEVTLESTDIYVNCPVVG